MNFHSKIVFYRSKVTVTVVLFIVTGLVFITASSITLGPSRLSSSSFLEGNSFGLNLLQKIPLKFSGSFKPAQPHSSAFPRWQADKALFETQYCF
jgi:hypothetical protein